MPTPRRSALPQPFQRRPEPDAPGPRRLGTRAAGEAEFARIVSGGSVPAVRWPASPVAPEPHMLLRRTGRRRGRLHTALLDALDRAAEPADALELSTRVRRSVRAVLPALVVLERNGWLCSSWSGNGSAPRRRGYELTVDGRMRLAMREGRR